MRDAAPPYGVEPGGDRYPADEVLADLPEAADAPAVARILARYAALRHWLLRQERPAGAPDPLTAHAAEAARAHLATAAGADRWTEGGLLARLADAPLREACGLLAAAAHEAAWAGDRSGAAALRRAARDATLLRLGEARRGRRPPPPPPPSLS